MDGPNVKLRYLIILTVFEIYQRKCSGYDVRCPEQSEWNLKATATCGNMLEYFCLLDGNVNKHIEFCKRNPDVFRDITWKKGHKCVLRGNLDGEACSKERYQPFKFRTDGNSNCAYTKSLCKGEGMILYKNGSTITDTQCRCDHTNGFAFVSQTKHSCYCIPSQEECSCHKKKCKRNFELSKDYICTSIYSPGGQLACSDVETRLLINTDTQTPILKRRNADFTSKNEMSQFSQMIMIGRKLAVLGVLIGAIIVIFLIIYTNLIDSLKTTHMQCLDGKRKNKATHNANGKHYKSEIKDNLENIIIDSIPDTFRDFNQKKLQGWQEEDTIFTKTKALIEAKNRFESSNCVVVVGCPGSGKSSILRHITLSSIKNNFVKENNVFPVIEEPSMVLEYHNRNRNQIFVIDNFCGKDKVNIQLIDVWKFDIESICDMINDGDDCKAKILIACSNIVYYSNLFKPLKKRLKPYFIGLHSFDSTPLERQNMLRKYAPNAELVKHYDGEPIQNFGFPLLCRLSKGKDSAEINKIFSDPSQYIKENLKKIGTESTLQFCAITLCTIFNNAFKIKWLDHHFEQENPHLSKIVKKICSVFDLDISKDADRKSIQDQFSSKMYWLRKSNDSYSHIHDHIFIIASEICGELYAKCCINHATSSFIAQRFNISLGPENEQLFFVRLFKDLKRGITYSTFQNIKLENKSYRKTFIDYCNQRETDWRYILSKLQGDNVKSETKERQLCLDCTICEEAFCFHLKTVNVPLHDCACMGYQDLIELLLATGCDVNEKDTLGRSALMVASAKGHIQIVKMIIETKKATIDLCDSKERTALHMACEEGHIELVTYLLKNRADVSARDKDGCSPFHVACASGENDIVKLLLKRNWKVDINQRNSLGRTALFLACSKGKIEVAKSLLQSKANIATPDKEGVTPLMIACRNGFIEIAEFLMKRKATNIFHRDVNERSALFIACEQGHMEIAEKLINKNQKIVKCYDHHDRSPLYIACDSDRLEIVQMLLRNNADITACDRDNISPLYVACKKGNTEIAKCLLQKEVESNISEWYGKLPLLAACEGGHLEIVELLIEHVKHLSMTHAIREEEFEKAQYMARRKGYGNIVIYLNNYRPKKIVTARYNHM